MKPNSKTGCNLLQFFSKYDRGLQVQKQVLFGMNADPLLPPAPQISDLEDTYWESVLN